MPGEVTPVMRKVICLILNDLEKATHIDVKKLCECRIKLIETALIALKNDVDDSEEETPKKKKAKPLVRLFLILM